MQVEAKDGYEETQSINHGKNRARKTTISELTILSSLMQITTQKRSQLQNTIKNVT